MNTTIKNTDGGVFAVVNENGSYVGFGKTRKIAESIKERADKATKERIVETIAFMKETNPLTVEEVRKLRARRPATWNDYKIPCDACGCDLVDNSCICL